MMLLPPSATKSQKKAATPASITSEPFAVERLSNGLQLRYHDQSNRYFGDYHRVRIFVEIELELTPEMIPDVELLATGSKRFGSVLITGKVLERMGVPGDRVDSLRAELAASFQLEAQSYLSRPEVPQRLLQSELAIKPSASTILRMR